MYPYLVHIEREGVRAYAIRTSNRQVYEYYNPVKAAVAADTNRDEITKWEDFETFYCRDLVSAEALAADFAAKKPGRAVYVCTLASVTQAPATAPVISNYTEKGLVPR